MNRFFDTARQFVTRWRSQLLFGTFVAGAVALAFGLSGCYYGHPYHRHNQHGGHYGHDGYHYHAQGGANQPTPVAPPSMHGGVVTPPEYAQPGTGPDGGCPYCTNEGQQPNQGSTFGYR